MVCFIACFKLKLLMNTPVTGHVGIVKMGNDFL